LKNDILEIKTLGYTVEIIEKYLLVYDEWVNVEFPERKLKKLIRYKLSFLGKYKIVGVLPIRTLFTTFASFIFFATFL
jgi:hypothetical protein